MTEILQLKLCFHIEKQVGDIRHCCTCTETVISLFWNLTDLSQSFYGSKNIIYLLLSLKVNIVAVTNKNICKFQRQDQLSTKYNWL